jgi:alpha-tubulin suppressor-like RCC1 family protein
MSNFISLDEGGDLDSIYLQEYELVDRFVGGSLWGWGDNSWGQLSTGDATARSSPVRIGTLTNWTTNLSTHTAILNVKQDGTLWVLGRNDVGELGLGDTTNRTVATQVGANTLSDLQY